MSYETEEHPEVIVESLRGQLTGRFMGWLTPEYPGEEPLALVRPDGYFNFRAYHHSRVKRIDGEPLV